jgi:sugar/nucleoside kinase (ribokinase family)
MAENTVLVVGDVMTDIIVAPEGPIVLGSDRRAKIRSHPGGSGANQAVWLAAQGAKVRFAARIGTADHERWQAHFAARNIEAHLARDPALPSGMLVTLLAADGERSFLTDRGANLALAIADLPDTLLDGVRLFLVSGYSLFAPGPRKAVLDLVARARSKKIAIAVDPASSGFLAECGADAFLGWIGGADIILANRDEAKLLTGTDDLPEQVVALGRHFAHVVVKCGAEGAVIGDASGITHSAPAPKVEAVDATGAGDAFAAGFLTAWLDGADPAAALHRAIEAGAKAVTHLGGQPA